MSTKSKTAGPAVHTPSRHPLPPIKELEGYEIVESAKRIKKKVGLNKLFHEWQVAAHDADAWEKVAAGKLPLGLRPHRSIRRNMARRSRSNHCDYNRCSADSRATKSRRPNVRPIYFTHGQPDIDLPSVGPDWLTQMDAGAPDLADSAAEGRVAQGLPEHLMEGVEAERLRSLGLFVVRESDKHARVLFEGQCQQTYLTYRHIPAVDAILRVGMAPRGGGKFWVTEYYINESGEEVALPPVEVMSHVEKQGDTKAYLFEYGGYYHLWSQSSAAKTDSAGKNEFTTILIRVLKRLRPINVYANNLSRLIRSYDHGHHLASEIKGNVDRIHLGANLVLDFVGEMPIAYLQLGLVGWCAAQERAWILHRLAAGRIVAANRGKWPLGKNNLPYGYIRDKRTGRPTFDLSKKDEVAAMMLIISAGGSNAEIAARLDENNVNWTTRQANLVRPYLGQKNLHKKLNRFLPYASVWCFGEYLFRLECGFERLTELAGAPISRRPGEKEGEIQLLCKLPLPPGGWAEPEVLQDFLKAAQKLSSSEAKRLGLSPRPLAETIVLDSKAPRVLASVLTPSAFDKISSTESRVRSYLHERDVMLPFAGDRWVEEGQVYETHVAIGGDFSWDVWTWSVDAVPDDIDPETGRYR